MQHSSRAAPGGSITYSVWVWSTRPATQVTARAFTTANAMSAPVFTLCPAGHGASCSLGTLPANQAFEMLITAQVRTSAVVGHQVTLSVTVRGAGQSPANASVTTVLGPPRTRTSPGGSPTPITTLPPGSFPTYPTTTVSPGSLSSLFPVVTPSPSQSGGSPERHSKRRLAGVTSSALPLDPRLIGGQLAALAVLAAAITMVVARLSLRTPQPAGAGSAPSAGTTSVSSSLDNATMSSSADAAPQGEGAATKVIDQPAT